MAKTSSLSKAWKLSAGREFFEIVRNGVASKWEYDVVDIKLIAEECERACGMRQGDSDKVSRPTAAFLSILATSLQERGCVGCTSDAAFRVYNVVNTQFAIIARDLEAQVAAIAKG